jgi:ADP-ribose pyrophosphatase YjhB (NUDIX family)
MPYLGVWVAVLHDGQVLLTKREDSDMWCLPGGGVDDGESLAAAAVREVREETGLEVRLTRLVGLYSLPARGDHVAVLAAEQIGGALAPHPGEVVEAEFFDPAALPADVLWWYQRPIREAVAGVGGSGVWTLDVPWSFPPGMSRAELYAMRDRSGLSRLEFARRHFDLPGDERAELPPG